MGRFRKLAPNIGAQLSKEFGVFRADIEGLRAIAVILVVIFHADLGLLHGGFIGVDMFFAISGYLITGLILAECETKGKLDFLGFYARRGRRLIPAVTAMIAVVLLVGLFIYSPDEVFQISKSGVSSAVYMSNVYFAMQPNGYFSTHMAENPFLHTWSLSVEEQFYLFWPLFVVICVKVTRSRLALLCTLGAITLFSFLIGLWLVENHLNWGFYALPGRVWEFGLGGFARVLFSNSARLPKPARMIVGWTGLGLVWPPSNAELKLCSFSQDGELGKIVLAGASHAKYWFSPVLGIAQDNDLELTTIMKAGCAFADVEVYNAVLRSDNPECRLWREQAIRQIIEQQPSLAIISIASGAHVVGTLAWGDGMVGSSRADWDEGLARALRPITEAGVPVLLIQHTPNSILMGQFVWREPSALAALRMSVHASATTRWIREYWMLKGLFSHRYQGSRLWTS